MKGDVKRIEIKCPKCGYVQLIEGERSLKVEDKQTSKEAS